LEFQKAILTFFVQKNNVPMRVSLKACIMGFVAEILDICFLKL